MSQPLFETWTVEPYSGWLDDVHRLIERRHLVETDGPGPTSLPESTGLRYEVVTGSVVREHAPGLYRWYLGLAEEISDIADEDLFPCLDLERSININVLEGIGESYEWHVDPEGITALLFASTHKPEDGGELAYRYGGENAETERLHPTQGQMLIFDGTQIPHSVAPMRGPGKRITIPMVLSTAQDRIADADLRDHLYA